MDLPIISALLGAMAFALSSYLLYKREQQTKQLLLERDEEQRQKLFELSVLKELQDKVGYSLDIERVVDVITSSLHNFFQYSAVSSLVIKGDALVFKSHMDEAISHAFIQTVKESMFASLEALYPEQLPKVIEENLNGPIDETNTNQLSSFFHIPLIINDKVYGIINISSTKPGLYKEQEMTMLYQITSLASNALSKLNEVLSTEEGKIMALIGSLTDGVFMLDTKKEIVVINDAAKRILDLKNNVSFSDITTQISNYDLLGNIEKALNSFNQLEPKEIEIGKRFVRIYLTTVAHAQKEKSGGREIYGVSVTLHDITLQRNLARIKEDFTHMIVHELRAPLTAIKGATSLIESAPKLRDEEKHKLIHTIYEQSKELLDDVNSLLDAAKLEAGRFSLVKSTYNIANLIEERIQFFTPEAITKKISLKSVIEKNMPYAYIDSFRIGQVINNLLSNSLKFTKENGSITISAKKTNDMIEVSVSDTGIGIAQDKQKNLFTKYGQASSEARLLGTGLGLYIAKGIIDAHGGTITLESKLNKGTSISFTLPISQVTEETKPHYLISSRPSQFTN